MLKKIHRPALLLLLVLIAIHSSAAIADSTKTKPKAKTKKDSATVFYFYNDLEKFGTVNLHAYDTSITAYQNYDPILKQSTFFQSQGNIGQASNNLVLYPFLGKSGFDYGIHTFDAYLFQNDSVKYYKVLKTVTELRYEQGAMKETFFDAIFSRNIYRTLNLGLDFRVMNAPGAYLRQRTNYINFVTTLEYFSKNKRYGVIANFRVNRLTFNENGGIKHDSIFEQNIETNRQLYDINLQSASNRVHENGFYMKHYFDLSRHPKSAKDTAYFSHRHLELGKIVYTFQYTRQVQNYIDYKPKSGFYQHIYLDSLQSYDSITVSKYVNELSWSNPSYNADRKFRVIQLEAHFKQQYIEIRDITLKRYFLQYIPSAGISFHPYSSLFLTGYGDYVIGDFNGGDMSLNVNLSQTLGKPGGKNGGTILIKGNYALQKPGWFYEHYIGNNFNWDTAWLQQSMVSGCFEYNFRNMIDAGLSISRIDHFVYLDSAIRPSQYNKQFGYVYAFLNTNLKIWRLELLGKFAYQTIQGTTAIRLPAFLGKLGVYFTQPLFHGAAVVQPGFDFNYNSTYYADSYMPAFRSYYLQDKKEIGNYLYMDVFVNIKIQRARFFVKYSHFNASLMGRSYYTVPNYPMQDATFHFGIAWRFHD